MATHQQDRFEKKYPLLEEILAIEGLSLKAIYSTTDIAKIFKVSVRAIQNRVTSGQLTPRNLPGRGKFLPQDLEDLLAGSREKAA